MKVRLAVAAAALLVATTGPSLADKIDGDWCSPAGKTISVDGPRVVTPGGNTVVANYNRHHVDFKIPEGEAGAGGHFSADQLNHEQISVTILASDAVETGQSEIWTPCKPIS